MTTKKPGRPPKLVEDKDLRIIESMAGRGATLDDIALVVGVSSSTLDRWLKDDAVQLAYRRGRAIAKDTMAQTLWDLAMSGEIGAVIFWLKSQAGWTEKPKEEVQTGSQVVVYIPDNARSAAA